MTDQPPPRVKDPSFFFKRYGRTYQLRLRRAADLRLVLELDEAHFVATSAPINTLHCDPTFLELLDEDHDGRIRPFELRQAIIWTLATLKETGGLERGSDQLAVAAINDQSPDGLRIIAAMTKLAQHLHGDPAAGVSLAQLRRIKQDEQQRNVSEGGVVAIDAAESDELRRLLEAVRQATGGTTHPSGQVGISQADLDQFASQAKALLDWRKQGQLRDDQPNPIKPVGEQTAEAFELFRSLRAKLDQYFAQCRAVAFDSSVAAKLGVPGGPYDLNDPRGVEAMLKAAPLAEPTADPDPALAWDEPINPAYAQQIHALRRTVVQPLLGPTSRPLSLSQWEQIKQRFAPYENWLAGKPTELLDGYADAQLQELTRTQALDRVRELIARSSETALVLDNLRLVEKVMLYQNLLMRFANNYVSFPELYRRGQTALFDMGNLIMDGRRFNLAVRVHDRAEHARIAQTSNICVLYVQISGQNITPYEVAVAVTSGGQGNLCVGKRGIFNDVANRELDARVVQVIANPISLGEAMLAPFRRLGAAVVGKIESIGSAAEKKLDQAGGQMVTEVQTAAQRTPQPTDHQPSAPPSATPVSGGNFGGLMAGGGIAIAALGSSFAFITKTLAGLNPSTIFIGLGAAIGAVILPTTIIAFFRLRRRDLSAILEGSGWAINLRMRLSYRQSRYFTERPAYPRGACGLVGRWVWRAIGLLLVVVMIGGTVGYVRHVMADASKADQTMRQDDQPPPTTPQQSPDPAENPAPPPASPDNPG